MNLIFVVVGLIFIGSIFSTAIFIIALVVSALAHKNPNRCTKGFVISFLCLTVSCIIGIMLGAVVSDEEETQESTSSTVESISETVSDSTTAATETTEATEAMKATEVTEPQETTDAERVGVSEKELEHILNALNDYNRAGETEYELEDIDLIRKDNDVLVDYEEYIVFMKDGEVIRMVINKILLDK